MISSAVFTFLFHMLLYSEHTGIERALCIFEINLVDKMVLPRSDYIALQIRKKERQFSLNYLGFEL